MHSSQDASDVVVDRRLLTPQKAEHTLGADVVCYPTLECQGEEETANLKLFMDQAASAGLETVIMGQIVAPQPAFHGEDGGWRGEAAITNATTEYMSWWKDLQQYANAKGLELGVYDPGVNGNAGSQAGYLRGGRDDWRMNLTGNATGSLGSMCRAGPFGDEYLANLTQMMDFAGLSQLNNDGDGNEQPCYATNHGHVPSNSVIKTYLAEIKLWQSIVNRTVWPGNRRAWSQGATSKFWVGGQQGADGGFDNHGFCTDNSGIPPCNSTMQWIWRERAALFWAHYAGIGAFSYLPVSVTLCRASETNDCYVGFFPGSDVNPAKGAPGGISIEPFEGNAAGDTAARFVQYDWALSGPMGMGAVTYIRGRRL